MTDALNTSITAVPGADALAHARNEGISECVALVERYYDELPLSLKAAEAISDVIQDLKDLAGQAAAAPAESGCAEPLVRYCPGCGSVGPVEAKYRDCCPDGTQARNIPKAMAEKCHDTFQAAVKQALEASAVLGRLDALVDDAAEHIFPADLAKYQTSECTRMVVFVRMCPPDGPTVPLFSREQVAKAMGVEGADA